MQHSATTSECRRDEMEERWIFEGLQSVRVVYAAGALVDFSSVSFQLHRPKSALDL